MRWTQGRVRRGILDRQLLQCDGSVAFGGESELGWDDELPEHDVDDVGENGEAHRATELQNDHPCQPVPSRIGMDAMPATRLPVLEIAFSGLKGKARPAAPNH